VMMNSDPTLFALSLSKGDATLAVLRSARHGRGRGVL